jgi:hypothetical protein
MTRGGGAGITSGGPSGADFARAVVHALTPTTIAIVATVST